VEPLARALGIPEFPGQLDATLTPVSLAGGSRLEARGSVVLRAFGGSFTFTDLEVENIVEPYSDLHLGAGKIEGVRLRELGDTFHFGIMSGVLKGEVLDLRFTGGEISAFDLDVETVRVEDVPQYLDRRALESIRRVLSGVLGAIEESIFSRFRYYRFGFWARLRDGVLRLQGKYRRKGVEYLMYSRWHEFPSIQIVNGRPEMPYDWRSIVENLKQVYEKGKEEP
jgi:hypothetical protein